MIFRSWRGWSWLLGGLSVVPVLFGAYQNWQFSRWAEERAREGGFVCGTGSVLLVMACVGAALALALPALACGAIACFRTPRPRPRRRMLELLLVGIVPVLLLAAGLVSAVAG